ncbi:MAG TPA: ABC transporter ATP-binding protein [Acidimicrobiales bacterium]|nr:ABC transporter ATP-binding protein [Acidimicrobiales bacterium]
MSAATEPAAASGPIVEARGLREHFPVERGLLQRVHGHVQAVDGVDLVIGPGQSIGLVGESGSGKSTLGRLITRLLEPTGGTLLFDGRDITHAPLRRVRPLRRHMQMVFQDPYSSLAPYSTVGESVAEPLRTHLRMRGKELDDRVDELLRTVRLSPSYRSRYPHEFSGGQLQRISVARALATSPKLIILDEPVSSLDVSTQAEVINLLSDLRREVDVAYLFIAHDLSVVRHVSDQTAVMYLGRIVELGPTESVHTAPLHPYTQALLSAVPVPDPVVQRSRERIVLQGDIPSPIDPPSGCRFHTRCLHVMDVCRRVDPPPAVMSDGTTVFCHLHPPDAGVRPSGGNGDGPTAATVEP